jgi:hypothetical protein
VKNLAALAVGTVIIIVALAVASGTTNQDRAERPDLAFAMATALHSTPSATPTDTSTPLPTYTPGPTVTPLHLQDSNPTSREILALLFQYPQDGSAVTPSPTVGIDRVPLAHEPHDLLIVTGDGGQAVHQGRKAPVAYGAVLSWQSGEYFVAFEHVEFGHRNASVIYALGPDEGEIRFVFQDIGIDPGSSRELRRLFTISCASGPCVVVDTAVGHSI